MRSGETERKAQEEIARAAGDLAGVRDYLQGIAGTIPEPPEEVLEHEAPRTLAAELKGGLQSVSSDLDEAVSSLVRLAGLRPEDVEGEVEVH